ncbi:MAG: UDP-glucose 4-epimerase GalE [Syntrophomonadaceae bacterium]|nr:UDP-glucose 4-epimerase GalE [Syntrophomonadaceae bacterium]
MSVLITGGTGYVGSHVAVRLLQNDCRVVLVDNLSNSDASVRDRIERLARCSVRLYPYDLCDIDNIRDLFERERIEAVVHAAGSKAANCAKDGAPHHYACNLTATRNLLSVMNQFNVKKLVFNSSAAVYGAPLDALISEDLPEAPIGAYGQSVLEQEQILRAQQAADPQWSIALLRRFALSGAHASGWLGASPRSQPNGLLSRIAQVAEGRLEKLEIYGGNYNTPDGTAIRDYVHVMDVAAAHAAALQRVQNSRGLVACNLGTGRGHSVLEVINTFAAVNGVSVRYEIVDPRPQDPVALCADPTKARWNLKWRAAYSLKDICCDTWEYQCFAAY